MVDDTTHNRRRGLNLHWLQFYEGINRLCKKLYAAYIECGEIGRFSYTADTQVQSYCFEIIHKDIFLKRGVYKQELKQNICMTTNPAVRHK